MNLFERRRWHRLDTGRFETLAVWEALKDLPNYGHNPVLRNPERNLSQYVEDLLTQGYLLMMDQEIPFYCLRDTSGTLTGIEFRFGRKHYVPG